MTYEDRMNSKPADSHGDWVLWQSATARERLYLPPVLVSQLVAEEEQQARNDRAAIQEEQALRAKQAATAAKTKVSPTHRELQATGMGWHRAHKHEVDQHQVFPRIEVVEERLDRFKSGFYGELDVVTRQIKALGGALSRGPMRSIARRPDWRQALDELAAELPAFKAAIRVITNALALAEATGAAPSVSPILIVGAPGVGKSYFCRRLAQTLQSGSAWIAMDQHTAGADLRGSDSHWATSKHGALFDLLGLGDTANPLVVLDEIDKAPRTFGTYGLDMLAQLYSSLEPETSRNLVDVSLDVELDASLVMYVGTANHLKTFDAPLLSRFEVVQVGLPSPSERRESTSRVIDAALRRLGVHGTVKVSPGCTALLADFSARVVHRAVEKAVGAAVACERDKVGVEDMEVALGITPAMHETPGLRPH